MKVWLKITRPVIRTSMPGKRSRTSSASLRANSTTRGPSSASSSPGSCTMTLIPPTPPSRARRRAASRGSARAMARIRDRSPGSPRTASSTRSRTRMSSPSAVVCWKLVTESTRVEYGDLPGLLGEPCHRLEREGRGGVAVLRRDGEEDVAALPVRVLHRVVREEAADCPRRSRCGGRPRIRETTYRSPRFPPGWRRRR